MKIVSRKKHTGYDLKQTKCSGLENFNEYGVPTSQSDGKFGTYISFCLLTEESSSVCYLNSISISCFINHRFNLWCGLLQWSTSVSLCAGHGSQHTYNHLAQLLMLTTKPLKHRKKTYFTIDVLSKVSG